MLLQLKKISEVKHLLPQDCWAVKRNEQKGELENDLVAWVNGDWETGNLDLDMHHSFEFFFPGLEMPEPYACISLVFVSGNLKARDIFCEETDGATDLIVTGNLEAENITVGGQEIFVQGNLSVSGLYWGDYNHGALRVQGHIAAHVFISTDYSFDVERFDTADRVEVDHFFWDESDEEFDRDLLAFVFQPDCLVAEDEVDEDELYSWNAWLDTSRIRQRLLEGLPVLLDDPAPYIAQEVQIPFIFESNAFNPANLQRLRESPVFLDHIPADAEKQVQEVEYWRGEIFKRVVVVKRIPLSEQVYFQQGDKAILIRYEKNPALQGQDSSENAHRLAVLCRTIVEGEEPAWYYFDPRLPAHQPFVSMTQPLWEDLLREWSEIEYWHEQFNAIVTREKVERILALPLVKDKYSDYYSDDGKSLSIFNGQVQFRQGSEGRAPRISIVKYTRKEDEYNFYHYDIRELRNGETRVLLYDQASDGYESKTWQVGWPDVQKYRDAIRYFTTLELLIDKKNKSYLLK